jgi:PBP1b-binding outer membrane lipoprotein LpoB
MKINKPLFYISIFTLLIIGSCKKKDDTTDTNTTSASNCVVALNSFSAIKNIVDEAGFKNGTYNGILNDTTIHVRFDTINHTDVDTISIDFGASFLLCADGRIRKGKITTTYNGHYADTSKTHLITLTNYYVDNNRVNGSIKDNYKGYNTTGHQHFYDTVNGNITLSTGKMIAWNATTKLDYTAGDSTTVWSDNILSINGNASGSTSDGDGYSMLISTPVVRNFGSGCRQFLVKGVMQIAVSGKDYRAADLGDGTCDDLITVSIDGNNYQVHTN